MDLRGVAGVRRRLGEPEFRERCPGSDEGYALLTRVL